MVQPSTQLILPGIKRSIYPTLNNFIVGKNQVLLQHLHAQPSEISFSFTYLWGHSGSGCSHLLEACCDLAGTYKQSSMYISLKQLSMPLSKVLQDLTNLNWLCIDDLEYLQTADAQEALFHQFNRMQATGGRLLIAAKAPPRALHCELADLQSRLASGWTWQVHALQDEDKVEALQQAAIAKGTVLSQTVAEFLLLRYSRSMLDLMNAFEQLDHAALTQKRRITIPFVKQVLAL